MNKIQFLIDTLQLKPHPEGGYFSEIYKSNIKIEKKYLSAEYSGERSLITTIYYLLNGDDFSPFHRLKSDEIWHFYSGSPLLIHIITQDGAYKTITLGNNLERKESPVIIIPRMQWYAAEIKDKNSFTLAGCTVSPGFEFDDHEFAKRNEMLAQYPNHADLINRLSKY